MRKFKHKTTGFIATETLSEKNYKVSQPKNFTIPKWIIENSNDWEEIIEPKIEVGKIYKIKDCNFIGLCKEIRSEKCIVIGFDAYGKWCSLEEEFYFVNSYYIIEATKEEWFERLKEEAIKRGLVKGVKFNSAYSGDTFTLHDYKIDFNTDLTDIKDGCLMYAETGKWSTPIEEKKPILTTHDGVELFEGDKYFYVDNDYKCLEEHTVHKTDITGICMGKVFSTKEAAEEYIKWNKPKYSLNNFKDACSNGTFVGGIDLKTIIDNLIKLNK